jgi:branched-subunit amino acid ABC-type transport system permease component
VVWYGSAKNSGNTYAERGELDYFEGVGEQVRHDVAHGLLENVLAFVVVALGGLGNLSGTIVAGLLIGVAQAIVAAYWTEAPTVVIYAVMAAVLLIRPQGLFGIRQK